MYGGVAGGSFVVGESSTIVSRASENLGELRRVREGGKRREGRDGGFRAKGPRGDEEGRRHEGDGLREEKEKIERVSARMRVRVWAVSGSSRAEAVGEVDDAQL